MTTSTPAAPAIKITDPIGETEGRYLTPEGLAARLGIPVRTIRNWREAAVNKGPLGVRFGKHIRYLISDVEAWEAAEREAGRARPGRRPGKAADQ